MTRWAQGKSRRGRYRAVSKAQRQRQTAGSRGSHHWRAARHSSCCASAQARSGRCSSGSVRGAGTSTGRSQAYVTHLGLGRVDVGDALLVELDQLPSKRGARGHGPSARASSGHQHPAADTSRRPAAQALSADASVQTTPNATNPLHHVRAFDPSLAAAVLTGAVWVWNAVRRALSVSALSSLRRIRGSPVKERGRIIAHRQQSKLLRAR